MAEEQAIVSGEMGKKNGSMVLGTEEHGEILLEWSFLYALAVLFENLKYTCYKYTVMSLLKKHQFSSVGGESRNLIGTA